MAMTENTVPPGEAPEPFQEEVHDPRRRDFINVAAASFAGVGALAIVPALVLLAFSDALIKRSLEPVLRERIAARVQRGKVECRMSISTVAGSAVSVSPACPLIERAGVTRIFAPSGAEATSRPIERNSSDCVRSVRSAPSRRLTRAGRKASAFV